MANSSPPKRATTSYSRTWYFRIWATPISTASPARVAEGIIDIAQQIQVGHNDCQWAVMAVERASSASRICMK
jgi:hypothetical protein